MNTSDNIELLRALFALGMLTFLFYELLMICKPRRPQDEWRQHIRKIQRQRTQKRD